MQDSQGHRETTVTRRRGDQAFITTTKEDGQNKDYREEVLNMDDREWGGGAEGGHRGARGCTLNEPPLLCRGAGAVCGHVAAAR